MTPLLLLAFAGLGFALGWFARGSDISERHPTPPAQPIDEPDRAGVPSQQRDTPTAETIPNDPRRRIP
jgi:hypothetical protein